MTDQTFDPDRRMTPRSPGEHYAEAERHLALAGAALENPTRVQLVRAGMEPGRQAEYLVARARVHATLATANLAAVTGMAPAWTLSTPVVAWPLDEEPAR